MPQVIWTKLLGTGSYDWASSLTTGSDGAIYVAGYTYGNLDGQVNSGSYDSYDAFVTKYNTDGTKKNNEDLELPYPDLSKFDIYKQ